MYYESYFELTHSPFSIAPDPRYLFLTSQHREALAHLLYGVNSQGGFVLLTGEIGAGKTTICQCLLDQLPDNTDVAYILNPQLRPVEFFAAFCDELGVEYDRTNPGLKEYLDRIGRYLLQNHGRGRNTVLIVDEAQGLSTRLMEYLRLLTNLETQEKKLLQIMLVGQPELRDKIARPQMEQMAQRITARFHLGPLSRSEIADYVRHRLKVAGAKRPLFSRKALRQLWKYTGGVPRLVNIICDRALLGAFVSKQPLVDERIIDHAAVEVLGKTRASTPGLKKALATAAILLVVGISAFYAVSHARKHGISVSLTEFSNTSIAEAPVSEPSPTPIAINEIEAPVVEDREQPEKRELNPAPSPAVDAIEVETGSESSDLKLPTDATSDELLQQALGQLMSSWRIDRSAASFAEACKIASNNGLACLKGQGNLARLAKFNLPVIITLYDGDGASYPALIEKVFGDEVELLLGDAAYRVSSGDLNRWWYGEYLLFWQPPEGYGGPFTVTARGRMVRWLQSFLGETSDREDYFTESLGQKVRAFQRSNGLIADGIVGPQTIIAINNLRDTGAPSLAAESED